MTSRDFGFLTLRKTTAYQPNGNPVQWYDASTATTLDILTSYTLTSKQYLEFNGVAYIVLEEGDKIQITTEAGSTFSFIATFEVSGAQRT